MGERLLTSKPAPQILLTTWAQRVFPDKPPSIHTLRRWVREKRISPKPVLVGREYRVVEHAVNTGVSEGRKTPPEPVAPADLLAAFKILPLDQLRCLPPTERHSAAGIYFLWSGPQLLYIGQSIDVGRRIQHHRLMKTFSRATWMPARLDCLRAFELRYINHYNPPENISRWV
jgi:hypothetical protein